MTEETVLAEPKNITEAIARIMGELPAIGKERDPNAGVKYAYRGIETITGHAQALCAKYGVVFYPRGEITETKNIIVNGNPWTDTFVSVEYEVAHGPSDTSKLVRTPGIGRDNSDKGSNKGMTAAFKYALLQVFMIADPKDDGDSEAHATSSEPAATVHREAPVRRFERPAGAPAPSGGSSLISEPQVKLVNVLFGKKGFPNDRQIKHDYAALVIERDIESIKELTKKEASTLIDALNAEPDGGDD